MGTYPIDITILIPRTILLEVIVINGRISTSSSKYTGVHYLPVGPKAAYNRELVYASRLSIRCREQARRFMSYRTDKLNRIEEMPMHRSNTLSISFLPTT